MADAVSACLTVGGLPTTTPLLLNPFLLRFTTRSIVRGGACFLLVAHYSRKAFFQGLASPLTIIYE